MQPDVHSRVAKMLGHVPAEERDEWDSLTQILMVLAAEKEFEIKFSVSEIGEVHDVASLIKLIVGKQVS